MVQVKAQCVRVGGDHPLDRVPVPELASAGKHVHLPAQRVER